MPDKPINVRRLVASVIVVGVLVVAANVVAVGIFVIRSNDSRQHNCQVVREAFDHYTDALIAAATNDEPNPEAQEAIDSFRADAATILEECR